MIRRRLLWIRVVASLGGNAPGNRCAVGVRDGEILVGGPRGRAMVDDNIGEWRELVDEFATGLFLNFPFIKGVGRLSGGVGRRATASRPEVELKRLTRPE